jgi:hypothetical protein
MDPTALIESLPIWHGLDFRSLLAANKNQVMTIFGGVFSAFETAK